MTDSEALVSIITPAYQARDTIRDAVASVRAQTYPHWEHLIVDDCSPDDTYAVLEELSAQEGRVRPLRHETNRGPAMARNTALAAARGRYVAFLDSDDWWLPEKLSEQLAFMRETGAAISYTQFRRTDDTGRRTGHLVHIPEQLTYRQLLKNTAIATSTAIVDRERSGSFSMIDTYYDDLVLWLSLLKRGIIAQGLRRDLMRYRVLGGSISRNKVHSAKWVWRTYRHIEGLSLLVTTWCFAHYVWNGWRKYRRF